MASDPLAAASWARHGCEARRSLAAALGSALRVELQELLGGLVQEVPAALKGTGQGCDPSPWLGSCRRKVGTTPVRRGCAELNSLGGVLRQECSPGSSIFESGKPHAESSRRGELSGGGWVCSTGLWLMSSYLVVRTLGGRDNRGGVVMMLVALCQQLLFSDCGQFG